MIAKKGKIVFVFIECIGASSKYMSKLSDEIFSSFLIK